MKIQKSAEKSLMDDFRGIYPGYIIANTLRRFGEGTKVAVEIVMEACDAGLVPEDEDYPAPLPYPYSPALRYIMKIDSHAWNQIE